MGGGRPDGRTRPAGSASGTLGRRNGNNTDKTVRIIECDNLRIWANRKQFLIPAKFFGKPWEIMGRKARG